MPASSRSPTTNKRLSLSPAAFYSFAMICPKNQRLSLLVCALLLGATSLPSPAQIALPGASPAAGGNPGGGAQAEEGQGDERDERKEPPGRKRTSPAATGVATIDGRPLMLNGRSGTPAGFRQRQDAAGRQAAPSRRERLRPVAALHCRHRRRKADRGVERGEPQTVSSATRRTCRPVRSRSTCSTARSSSRRRSPPASSRPPIARRAPAAFGGPTALRSKTTPPRSASSAPRPKMRWRGRCKPSRSAPKTTPTLRACSPTRTPFHGQRDDACRDYLKESVHGFCAASLTEARAALLEARLAGLSSPAAKETKGAKAERKKKKPKADASAQ